MAPVCGIDAETLREVARLYARSRASIIFWGMGISQHVHGTDNARCLIALALTTGQIGRPGTGLHPLRGQNNVQGASDAGLIPMVYPDYQSVEKDRSPADLRERLGHATLDPKRGLTVVEIMNAIHAGTIRGMYIVGENPAMSDPDLNHAREALAMLEHLVVQDLFLTETAFHADVILPASAFAEKAGTFTNTDRRVQLARPVIRAAGRRPPGPLDHPGDRPPHGPRLELRRPGRRLRRDGAADAVAGATSPGSAWSARAPSPTRSTRDDQPGNEIIFCAGFPDRERPRQASCPRSSRPPDEVPDDAYPMVLSTGPRARALAHRLDDPARRRARRARAGGRRRALAPRPRAARPCGRRAGFARNPARRGRWCSSRSDRDVPESMVFMPFCYAEAAANLLTNPALDPFGKIPEFKFCAVRVSRLGDALPTAAE